MRNSNSTPPRYGAEGPPGGPEAWARQRAQGGGKSSIFMRAAQGLANLPQFQQNRAQRPTQPDWSQGGAVQWPGQGGGPPQGMPPQAQGAPPTQPQGTPSMQSQPTQAQARPPQQYGMAGLGQAAGKGVQMMQAAALRRRGGMQQEQ